MADRGMARADLIMGAVFFVLSVAVIYGAWTMDRLEIRQIHPLSVPGLLPGLLGIALALCSILLITSSVRNGTNAVNAAAASDSQNDSNPGAFRRLALATLLCLLYALGFVGRLPFWLATTLFVTSFILIFEWSDRRGSKLGSFAWAVGIGGVTGLSVAYAFSEIFLVRLP